MLKKTNVNQDHDQIPTAQKDIALYLVRNYKDVKKIEFHEFKEVASVGYTAWNISVVVNEDNVITFSVNDLSKMEDATIRHNPKTFNLIKKESDITGNLDGVQIAYWEAE